MRWGISSRFVVGVLVLLLGGLEPSWGQKLEIVAHPVSCPKGYVITSEDTQAIKSLVDQGFKIYETNFPQISDVVVQVTYVCSLTPFGVPGGKHAPKTETSPEKIILPYFSEGVDRVGLEAYYRSSMAEQFFLGETYPHQWHRPLSSYVSWKMEVLHLPRVLFHELLHALADRSDLAEQFYPLIQPSFESAHAIYRSRIERVRQPFRRALNRRLRRSGFEDFRSSIRVGETGTFEFEGCWGPVPDARVSELCSLLKSYNDEVGRKLPYRMAQVSLDLHRELHLPYRHALDAHVFDSMNPTEERYDEEFMTISGEAAFFPSPDDFYKQKSFDAGKRRTLHKFWRETDFKNVLKMNN